MFIAQQGFTMFVFYRLFRRCIKSAPPDAHCSIPPEPPDHSLESHKDRAILLWWTIFGLSLFFRPAAELVIRIIFFSALILLISTLDGSLNLLVGHAVLRAAKYSGYDPPLLSSIEAGALGGIIVIGPTTLAPIFLVALLGVLKFQRAISSHIAFILELTSVVAASAAASSIGVTIMLRMRPGNGLPLDATHAARAGALGACILTVPILSTAAFLMSEAQTMPSGARNDPSTAVTHLVDSPDCPVHHTPGPRTRPYRHVVAHTAVETVGYVLVTLCILTIRLLCF